MWLLPSHFQSWRGRLVATAFSLAAALCHLAPAAAQEAQPDSQGSTANAPAAGEAQTTPAEKPPKPYGGGSPLDVIMNSKLWETVPEAKDFVKASRPPDDALEYQPTQVFPPSDETAPPPPKLHDSGELKSLEGELNVAGAHNEKAAGVKVKNFAAVKAAVKKEAKAIKATLDKVKALRTTAGGPTDLHPR